MFGQDRDAPFVRGVEFINHLEEYGLPLLGVLVPKYDQLIVWVDSFQVAVDILVVSIC